MCLLCSLEPTFNRTFEFPVHRAQKADPVVERLEYVENVLGQLLGDDQ